MTDLLTSHTYSSPIPCSHCWFLNYLAKLHRTMWLFYWCRFCTICLSLMLEQQLSLFLFFFLSFLLSLSLQLPSLLWPFLNDEWGSRCKMLTVVERARPSLCKKGWTHPSTNWMFVLNDFSVSQHHSRSEYPRHTIAKKYSIIVETGWTMSAMLALMRGKAILPLFICRELNIQNIKSNICPQLQIRLPWNLLWILMVSRRRVWFFILVVWLLNLLQVVFWRCKEVLHLLMPAHQ